MQLRQVIEFLLVLSPEGVGRSRQTESVFGQPVNLNSIESVL